MLLIVGRSGQVARALARGAAAAGISARCLGRPELDLESDPAEITAAIAASKPSVVINAAAYTQVDRAEDEPERAWRINARAAEAIAQGAASAGAALIHISTDYVFDGTKAAPYVEADQTGPTGAYGRSKLEGEQRLGAAHPGAIVLRTAWVFDATGQNFVRTMLRLAKTRDEVGVVADQAGCPTFASDLAAAALEIAAKPEAPGLYHCAGGGETTWAGFAQAIFAASAARGGPVASVKSITTADYPTRARRPANSRLDCTKLTRAYGVRMRPWSEALAACMDEIAAQNWRVE